MGEMKTLKRLLKKGIDRYATAEGIELRRIEGIPRYQRGDTKILGADFAFPDSASFVGQYLSIIKTHVYNFKADNDQPYIVDCGANIGVSILYFKKIYPKSEIIAFEPDKNIFSILKKNIDTMGYDSVTLVNKGLWNTEGKIQFIAEGADGGSILPADNGSSGESHIAEIETTSLKPYLQRRVDFLKIDIEGAESTVIDDCQDLLQNVQRIFIEFHSRPNEPQHLDFILGALTKSGFRYYIESSALSSSSPFIKRDTINNFDNLLNIFAYR